MPDTPYADVNRLLEVLLSRMLDILHEKLVAVYLYGSVATGDFDHGVSDVDLLAATSSDLSAREFDALRAMLLEVARDNPEWEDRIEVAYLLVAALRTFRSQTSPIAVISPGEPFHMKEAGLDWLANWYCVRENGVALHGPPPHALIAPISREEFARCIRDYAADWSDRIRDVREPKLQAYAILTMCRALHLHKTGEQASKRRAALWAQAELPAWSRLIQSALAQRQAWRETQTYDAAAHADSVRFVTLVRDLVHWSPTAPS